MLDPGGAFVKKKDRLGKAAELAELMPSGATVLSQKSTVDVEEFARVLEEVPPESSAVFACHTKEGNGTPLSGGLLLCPPIEGRRTPEILTADRLINGPAVRIPRQVLLLACESADLRQAAEGSGSSSDPRCCGRRRPADRDRLPGVGRRYRQGAHQASARRPRPGGRAALGPDQAAPPVAGEWRRVRPAAPLGRSHGDGRVR
ncbi:hypothetical protein [Actinomadura madurae]|uniref:hypothetical protein n=1 Tax=Actinomadura madurae TaxID=1993 RepID=UPI0020D20CF6|nr:hypothetical protein [Actinomadura madurae]MCQ0020360.1 hypothetical protein [Actinomadura madurae]